MGTRACAAPSLPFRYIYFVIYLMADMLDASTSNFWLDTSPFGAACVWVWVATMDGNAFSKPFIL